MAGFLSWEQFKSVLVVGGILWALELLAIAGSLLVYAFDETADTRFAAFVCVLVHGATMLLYRLSCLLYLSVFEEASKGEGVFEIQLRSLGDVSTAIAFGISLSGVYGTGGFNLLMSSAGLAVVGGLVLAISFGPPGESDKTVRKVALKRGVVPKSAPAGATGEETRLFSELRV